MINTDSFNYDFHLKEIFHECFKQLSMQGRESIIDYNISNLLYRLIAYYKTPPKYSRNYMNVLGLKVNLGHLKGISAE